MKNQKHASEPAFAAHTPGPWRHAPDSKYVTAAGLPVAELIAVGGQFYPEDESTPAEIASNARLIAAAPEMLAALWDMFALATMLAESHEPTPASTGAIERARAVLAKAAGSAADQPK